MDNALKRNDNNIQIKSINGIGKKTAMKICEMMKK